jgi:hypothetical protein
MDPSQPLPQSSQVQAPEAKPQEKLSDKVAASVGDFVKDNHETYLHSAVNFGFMVLNFIKSSVIGIIRQVLKE